MSITSIPSSPDAFGQNNPHYDRQSNSVYFVDYFDELMFRYSLDEHKMYSFSVAGVKRSSFIVPVEGSENRFLISRGGSAVIINWDGVSKIGHIERTFFMLLPIQT